jgi:FMN phosphatase YigB (HAD superfamily)
MKTIIWDVDDVLNDLMRAWLDDWASSGGALRPLSYDQLTGNPPNEILEISMPEYLASLDAFRLSRKARRMRPVPEVLEWFSKYGNRFHHVALTAAPLVSSHISAGWVMKNFGRWIQSFNVVPSRRPWEPNGQAHAGKAEFLRWWGKGDVLVDDNPQNVAGALSIGMDAVLIPRPWNRTGLNLKEALETLTKLALCPAGSFVQGACC